jgi:O-antigen ligase
VRARDRIALAFGGAALLTSVLGVGGAVREVQVAVAVLVATALAISVPARRKLDRPSPLVVLLAAGAVLTALQLVPLPTGLLYALDGVGTTLRDNGAALAKTSPWRAISLDPSGTLRALTYFVVLIGVALIALRFSVTERGRYLLLAAVALTCGLAAIVNGIHVLLGADSLYGIYRPSHVGGVAGPLLNPNHMGGLMAIGAVLSAGLAFYTQQPTQLRVAWVVNVIGCAVALAASLSRGAMVGLLIGLMVVTSVILAGHVSRGRRRHWRLHQDLPIALVVGFGIALALYASAGNVVQQLGDTSLTELNQPISKYEAWKSSFTLVRQSPWVGVGRGAVEVNLTRVHPGSGHFTFSHLENEYLSAVVEWGVVGAAVMALAFAWCAATAIRRWRGGPLAAAALGALAAILFQSAVDFGIELLGIAVPVTIIASTTLFVPLRPADGLSRLRLSRGAFIAVVLAIAAITMSPISTTVQEDHDALLELNRASLADIRASIARHPLDYYGFGALADVASREGALDGVTYLNHALVLHPTHPGLHRLAARMLVGLKRYDQAAVEYSLAMSADPMPHMLLTEIVTLVPNVDDAAASIPADYPNPDVLLHSLQELKRSDIAEHWLWRVANRPQHDLNIMDTLYNLAMTAKDYPRAEATAELRLRVSNTTTSRWMLAKVQFQLRKFDVLLKELGDVRNWIGRVDEKAGAWLLLCDVHIELREWDPALSCIHQLEGSGLLASRYETNKRLQIITEQRTYESKMQAAQALEREIEAKKHTH